MGPTNTGGCTRALLIDNTDPTHQTLFAGGITGGIWKSTNGGATWGSTTTTIAFSQEDTMQNINICCLAQDAKGALYAGTGDGFTAYGYESEFGVGQLGGGIFKSTDDGKTWRLLKSTAPTPLDNWNVKWSYVNRIAVRPDSIQVIYAATNLGLMVSHDSGTTWNTAIKSVTSTLLTSNSLDVKISTDGSVVVADVGGYGYYCYPQSGNSNDFTKINSTGAGFLFGNASRIEFAISPTDANRIYASVIGDNSLFGTGGTASGIFMTMTGKTNGGYWYDIGPGGSIAFDPYSEDTVYTYDQATYDNTLGVFPANEAQVLVGGVSYWEWSGANTSDTVGAWEKIPTHATPSYSGDPLYIYPALHATVFDNTNTSTLYIGGDGGVFKCTDMSINPANPKGSIANLSFQQINRNYNVTQYYSLCYSPQVYYETVSYNNNPMVEGLGVGGGSQNNGIPYINGSLYFPNDAANLTDYIDGGGSAVSQLNPDIAYFTGDYGALLKENSLGSLLSPNSAYTITKGYDKGGNIDSVWSYNQEYTCFVFPVALYENRYDTLNHDSVQFTATENYYQGDTIFVQGVNGSSLYVLPHALAIGSKINVPDRLVSRLAIGFAPANGGIWINGQGASYSEPTWIPIGGPLSTPVSLTDAAPIHAITWSGDGNTLYIGTEDGAFYTLTNINSVIANSYKSGALWSNGGNIGIIDTTNQVVSADLTTALGAGGRDILSISVDQNDPNNVLVAVGNYGNTTFVYYSRNALSASPIFASVQGNLPEMPVYSSILDLVDSTGQWVTNSAIIGTEHGIYTSTNINAVPATNVKWTKNNGGMANVMTIALKQQTEPGWTCNNFGVIYAATQGRGIWSTNNFHNVLTAVPKVAASAAANNLLVYPNPTTNQGNIQFTLSAADNVTITIYDMQGREVKTIYAGNQIQGIHTITFASAGLHGGTYFAALTGTNFRKVSKFVVVN